MPAKSTKTTVRGAARMDVSISFTTANTTIVPSIVLVDTVVVRFMVLRATTNIVREPLRTNPPQILPQRCVRLSLLAKGVVNWLI